MTPLSARAETVSGKVVAIIDGDTIEVLTTTTLNALGSRSTARKRGRGLRHEAKQAISELVFGKAVTLHTHGKDKSWRTIADVLLPDGTNVNQQLVKDGWYWWYQKYAPNDRALEQSEQEAKADGAPLV